jgi:ATP-dependent helicase/nuclease subunit B
MYKWLDDALSNSGTVVTANRRLARVLGDRYAAEQLEAGQQAWRSPAILSRQDWLVDLANTADDQADLPTRINAQQSQLLWERCLRKDLQDSQISIPNLARLSRETWQRLADWQVTIGEVAGSAQNEDQRLFATVAGRYLGVLEHENWVDDAGLGALVLNLVEDRRILFPGQHTFVGFDRKRPIIVAIQEAMQVAGTSVTKLRDAEPGVQVALQAFENTTAELRSAGAWARQHIDSNPEARIAIIANGLDKDADGVARRVRDSATPGWQHGHRSLFDAVNVSYGRRLSDYPAISIALMLLRWLFNDLSSADVGMLLRSPLVGTTNVAGRSRLELRLRQLPDRRWSPSMITAQLRGRDDGENVSDWLTRLAAFSKRRRELPKQATPADWAVFFDEVLRAFGWPGQSALDSDEFQLINRWRELLNEFARLGLVSTKMSPGTAASRIELMAGDTVFQPETTGAVVQLMGPLEASGAAFDALWLTGVTTANWPPAGAPSALVSRRLQEKKGMPDCTPADTLHYALEMLTRLLGSSESIVCSYALTEDDAEQTASGLLQLFPLTSAAASADPGWYAAKLTANTDLQAAEDKVPPVAAEEKISGGAGTIQRQLNDPVAAFVHGRMGARVIYPQAVGIPAMMRGNLIHDALYNLYIDLPSIDNIGNWQGKDLTERIDAAVNFAFARHERNVDAVLQQLLLLERRRISELLRQFVAVDGARRDFQVAGVEGKFEFVAGHIRLPLRFDRIDSVADSGIAILDYKTGARKQLLNRKKEVQEIQLFVYACATEAPVSALALVNVDSREIAFDGAGLGYTDVDEWPDLLKQIKEQISNACDEISSGDVRLNIQQGIKSARPLNLLTRYTELRRDN